MWDNVLCGVYIGPVRLSLRIDSQIYSAPIPGSLAKLIPLAGTGSKISPALFIRSIGSSLRWMLYGNYCWIVTRADKP
jgi:hypothetical protein